MKKNLVLTGMMSVGKSTIGKKLAMKLKYEFVDTDKIIEIKEKSTIKEIFKDKGENYFREIEKKITLEKLKKRNLVMALGGGAFVDELIRKEIKSACVSFWLDLNIESLLIRLKNDKKRPLLNQDKLEQSINKIYSERKEIYNESNFRIKCDSMNENEIINNIINLYENTGNKV